MTIKQNGGVFGRNPTFNDVTIEGELTFDGDIDINSDLKVNGNIEGSGNISTEGGYFGIIPSSPNIVGDTIDGLRTRVNTGSNNAWGTLIRTKVTSVGGGNKSGSELEFLVSSPGSTAALHALTISDDGNLVIVNSGNGIDFSATSGAGSTSELLDDYEEGTWSPAPEGGTTPGTSTIVSSTAYYTKVGRCVFFDMTLQATGFNGTGNFLIAGLPFAAIGTGVCSVVANNTPWQTLSADNQNVSALPSGSYIGFRTLNRNQSGAYSIPQCAPTSTGYLRISGTYHTA